MSQRALIARLAKENGLIIVSPQALDVRRQRCGKGFAFVTASGQFLRDAAEIARLKALAVPPAYVNVRYAHDAAAHLQAVGEDAAGRLQYRYHPNWTEVRETLKAQRLKRLAEALPGIRRALGRCLASKTIDLQFAAASVVELVARTAIRAGGEEYAREHGTRGATTLLKSNVRLGSDRKVTLTFKAKGGKPFSREVRCKRLHRAIARLLSLPGRRLFQFTDGDGVVRQIRASDVNAFLRSTAGKRISLKDFRTLIASAGALQVLANTPPGESAASRRRQIRNTVVEIAEELANTPAVCRTSYVHRAVVAAFEAGSLKGVAKKRARSPIAQADALTRLVARHGVG
jgi:DNA topoisomerase-1